ncbi:MAG: tRNA (guanine-N1)-methyltransferase [Gammaproteobacteria bacterium BRH_c0]|nr:MAG: tRNA (guanine-N1)-methyltransferase [Gammaproteobacteria bacterium BRH_c0]
MKRIATVTLFPEMFAAVTQYGITARALQQGLWATRSFNPRDYTADRHRTVDDRPYGGGPGMVMMIEPLRSAIADARYWAGEEGGDVTVVYLSPQGRVLDQTGVRQLDTSPNLVLVAGRYEGIDERLIELEIDEEWSIGDYVLSGGELPAMVLIDALVRQIPGALGHGDSAQQDSFAEGLLDCPHFTRPEDYQGRRVPEVLLSGNHERIRRWRLAQSLARTRARRPDIFNRLMLSEEQQALLAEQVDEDTLTTNRKLADDRGE